MIPFLNQEVLLYANAGDMRPMSAKYFRDTKIRTCSYVKENPNGTYSAVPFYDKRATKQYPTASQYTTSWSSFVHRVRDHQHAGVGVHKSLSTYRPNSARSRLLVEDFIPPYRNSSIVTIGTRDEVDRNRWTTTYSGAYKGTPRSLLSSNP